MLHFSSCIHVLYVFEIKIAITCAIFQGIKEDQRRMMLLAYLPNVTLLNGGKVTLSEKEDAERSFIRHYMDMDEKDQPAR